MLDWVTQQLFVGRRLCSALGRHHHCCGELQINPALLEPPLPDLPFATCPVCCSKWGTSDSFCRRLRDEPPCQCRAEQGVWTTSGGCTAGAGLTRSESSLPQTEKLLVLQLFH